MSGSSSGINEAGSFLLTGNQTALFKIYILCDMGVHQSPYKKGVRGFIFGLNLSNEFFHVSVHVDHVRAIKNIDNQGFF